MIAVVWGRSLCLAMLVSVACGGRSDLTGPEDRGFGAAGTPSSAGAGARSGSGGAPGRSGAGGSAGRPSPIAGSAGRAGPIGGEGAGGRAGTTGGRMGRGGAAGQAGVGGAWGGTSGGSAGAPPQCGNAVLESGEACDDGNQLEGDGCGADCHSASCYVPVTHALIQDAIDAGCPTVWVLAGTYQENLRVARDLIVVGTSGDVIIQPRTSLPILSITSGAVELRAVTLRGGAVKSGLAAGIVNQGALTLTKSQVLDNVTYGDVVRGGGIHSTGPLVLDAAIVQGNSAQSVVVDAAATERSAFGGGIYVEGAPLTLRNGAMVSRNSADAKEPSGPQAGALGGGIYAVSSEVLIDSSSAIEGNTLTSTNGAEGGGIFVEKGSVLVRASRVSENQVSGNPASGGGIAVNGATSVELAQALIQSNNLQKGGLFIGGGIAVEARAGAHTDVRIQNSLIRENYGDLGSNCRGGGLALAATEESAELVARISGSTGYANYCWGGPSFGGFASVRASAPNAKVELELVNSTLYANSAGSGDSAVVSHGSALESLAENAGSVKLDLSSVTIVDNQASDSTVLWADGDGSVESANVLTLRNTYLVAVGSSGCGSGLGTLVSKGYNFYDPGKCSLTGDTALDVAMDGYPFWGLAENGGPTLTVAVDSSSPAVDAGDPNGCKDATGALLAFDQRGVARMDRCDIGAYELEK